MPYATLQDLLDRFGDEVAQLTDASGLGVPDAPAVDRALAEAAEEIDSALRGRYVLPVMPVPDLLRRLACDLAREALFTQMVPETVAERAKAARLLLSELAAGRRRLDAPLAQAQLARGEELVMIRPGRRHWPL